MVWLETIRTIVYAMSLTGFIVCCQYTYSHWPDIIASSITLVGILFFGLLTLVMFDGRPNPMIRQENIC